MSLIQHQIESQQEVNDYYLCKLPRRYRHLSGVDCYDFKVSMPWHKPFNYVLAANSVIQMIPPSAHCAIKHKESFAQILIPLQSDSTLSQAVLLLGAFHFAGPHSHKYLNVFKAYECIASKPRIEFAAVRHALTHATAKLDRPRTVAALEQIFGTTRLDLAKYTHLSRFYKLLGQLLIETDSVLHGLLDKEIDRYGMKPPFREVLHDWQVAEIEDLVLKAAHR